MFGLIKILAKTNSPYNGPIEVVKTIEGRKIVVGGLSQSGWLVKKVWKAALKKVQKIKQDSVKEVLILGLGGGSAAVLVQNFWPEARITGVDIDPIMVSLGRKYLELGKVKNLNFIATDAKKWIVRNKKKFDLILIDLYKGRSIPKGFLTKNFLNQVKKSVNKRGIVVFNHLYSDIEKYEAQKLGETLHDVFGAITIVQPEANIIFICHT